ncbi:MAG: adenosine deaminase [Geodermatophilaceae bacterium]
MTSPTQQDFIAGLPKCELHLHIEGTLEPELKFALAERNGIRLKHSTVEEVRASYNFDSLTTFLVGYYDSMRVLCTAEDFYDLAMAYLTKAASQNVRHVEMFFDPQAHTGRGVAFTTVVEGLRRAVLTAHRDLDVPAELILCFLRDLSAEFAMATLVQALPYKDWILGVGLDSDERGHPPEKFAEVFARARAEGFQLTMHCDVDQPGSIDNLRTVLDTIGVDRIDHGTNIVEDPALVARVREQGIGLTCCPVSNVWVTQDMKAEEIVALLRAGVLVCINSDDPAYFAAYIGENFLALAEKAELSVEELAQLSRNAFEIAWLPSATRDRYLTEIDQYVAAL